jgi:hypothetical protein
MAGNAGKKLGEEELAKKSVMDLGEIRDEAGTLSRFRRNTETGEMYDPTGSSSGKSAAAKDAAAAKKPSASVTKMPEGAFRGVRSDMKDVGGGRSSGRGGPEAGEGPTTKPAGAYRGTRSDMKGAGAGRGGRGGPEAGEEAAYRAKAPAAPEGALRGMRSDMPSSGLSGVRRPGTNVNYENEETSDMKRGGKVKKMASGGMTSSASKRADGIAVKGKTRGKMY